ncbi:MAG: hypothetical protein H0U78_01290 [Rickettsiaceae bacterium]|nr:hypothetical protein [Rickettsiaceae bacterium]
MTLPHRMTAPPLHKEINAYLAAPTKDLFDIVKQTVISESLAGNYDSINQVWLRYTPLGRAAKANDIALLKLLVDNGADTDYPGHSNDSIKTMLSAHYHDNPTYSLNDLLVLMHFIKLVIPHEITVKCHEFGQNNLQAYKAIIKERDQKEFSYIKEVFNSSSNTVETSSSEIIEIAGLVLEYLHVQE